MTAGQDPSPRRAEAVAAICCTRADPGQAVSLPGWSRRWAAGPTTGLDQGGHVTLMRFDPFRQFEQIMEQNFAGTNKLVPTALEA